MPNNGFNFDDLFVFDLANNHQGSVSHALNVIRGIGEVAHKHRVRGALKFQFRDLDSLIHPAHRSGSDAKHIPRFLSTRLNLKQYQTLLEAVRDAGMLAMCTAFDEPSVRLIGRMGFDLIKVASCSAKDWPLLEEVAELGLPVIFSTGGLAIEEIDGLVNFFEYRGTDFAIMHCVSLYPIPPEKFNLSQIDTLRKRYPGRTIGWSTHEDPDAILPVQIAVAKGARIFERHVGIATSDKELNTYSSAPAQIDRWISAYKEAEIVCGANERFVDTEEIASLNTLRRGVFARLHIRKGELIDRENAYFAMPYREGQLESGGWRDGIVALADIAPDEPLTRDQLKIPEDTEYAIIKSVTYEVKALLNQAGVSLGSEFEVEYSHHYGIQRFREFGAVIITCINREYCKKILIQLPGQRHPAHHHKQKEETFQALYGRLETLVDGHARTLLPGDTQLILPGVWHSFWTDTGCVFEEVSTTDLDDGSIYRDKEIQKLKRHQRKTIVDHWGHYQLDKSS